MFLLNTHHIKHNHLSKEMQEIDHETVGIFKIRKLIPLAYGMAPESEIEKRVEILTRVSTTNFEGGDLK